MYGDERPRLSGGAVGRVRIATGRMIVAQESILGGDMRSACRMQVCSWSI